MISLSDTNFLEHPTLSRDTIISTINEVKVRYPLRVGTNTDNSLWKTITVCGEGTSTFAIDRDGHMWSWGRSAYYDVGQGDYQLIPRNYTYSRYTIPENYLVVKPRLVYTNTGEIKDDWVKITRGESSTMAMDSSGQLWGCGMGSFSNEDTANCATFGLPQDSGNDEFEWQDGVDPRVAHQYYFFKMTEVVPGFVAKDFVCNTYYTLLLGTDNLVYWVGTDDVYSTSGQPENFFSPDWDEYNVITPTRIVGLNDEVKFLMLDGGFTYDIAGCVTMDNKVLIWGYGASYLIDEYDYESPITDVSAGLPSGVNVVSFYGASWWNLTVLLANGDVYVLGTSYAFDDGPGWYPEFTKIPGLSNIVSIDGSQTSACGIDSTGDLYTWDYGDYQNGLDDEGWGDSHPLPEISTVGTKWNMLVYNYYQSVWAGIDSEGRLMTWGSQSWGPHLGIGTAYNQTQNDMLGITIPPVTESLVPVVCVYPGSEDESEE